jgi:putative tryptophan/tyrosine transport system substrate-binding protein
VGQRTTRAVARRVTDGVRPNGRRTFLRDVAVATALVVGGRQVRRACAQPRRLPSVGYPTLIRVGPAQGIDFLNAFRQGLSAHGYTENKDIVIELRDAGGVVERLPAIIQELVRLPVSVFVLPLSNTVPMAAKMTRTIPIVSTLIGDPVALGLAESLAHPTGNVTGLTVYGDPLTGKRLELLKEAAPAVRRVGLLRNSDYPETARDLSEAKTVAPRLGLALVPLGFTTQQDLLPALESGVRQRIDSLVVVPDAVTAAHVGAIVRFATDHRLPGVFHNERFANPAVANPGGLVGFGPDRIYNLRRAAFYVDRLLKGARPQDLPFEQPTRFRLAVSLRAASHLKLTLPQSLLLRATDVFD